ncbi:MAG: roadblock/LC7 domain-containing protein [Acidobacteriota bacterium]|jgi:predicted regulator of Ras-like GTPase activity (Roadblock/LC7/MglB family)
MAVPDLVMFDEEYGHLKEAVRSLRKDANAKAVFLVDKNGQQIASAGELEQLDGTSLASLTAGTVAATDGLARILGEKEFSVIFHEGERDSLHISVVSSRMILVVIFDERSSLGLVRLRVRKTQEVMTGVFAQMEVKSAQQAAPAQSDSPFAEITDDDIDALFSD